MRWAAIAISVTASVSVGACVSRSGPPTPAEVPPPVDAPIALRFVDDFDIPTGTTLDGIELGGLSGLWIDPRTGHGVAISDGHEEHGPPRFYALRVSWTPTLHVEPRGHTSYDTGATPAPMMDAEGIVRASSGEIYVASEGKPRASPPVPPSIVKLRSNGELVDSLPIPEALMPDAAQTQGVRHNKGLESLAIAPSGTALFAATEHALIQDGPAPDFERGTRCRLLRYDIGRPKPTLTAAYVYETDPIPRPSRTGEIEAKGIGVVELLALSEERMLVLERAGVKTDGVYANTIRVYEVRLRGAENVMGLDPLPTSARPLDKHLLLELDSVRAKRNADLPELDNFEGMSLGPRLPDGRRTLLLVSDNNFKRSQRTAFFAFAVDE